MTEPTRKSFALSCPVPKLSYDHVILGHGSGGRLSGQLLRDVFLSAFDNEVLAELENQATLSIEQSRLALTTDSYVIRPLFFPGGDIGRLAVSGTVNDLAVGGAIPLYLSAGFILEEGMSIENLQRIVLSMQQTCEEAGVQIVTGDTKVVDRGKGDQVFINTTGIGLIPSEVSLSIRHVQPGDQILISGTIGDHGMAIMSVREGLEFETELQSDSAPLNHLIQALLKACPDVRWMRDPTRGGVSSTLNELATGANVGVELYESELPIRPEVRGACEMLGFDPLYVANEGKVIVILPEKSTNQALDALRAHPLGIDATLIGSIVAEHPKIVTLKSAIGGERVVSLLAGEQLPRIC